jgi:hypothetical protein
MGFKIVEIGSYMNRVAIDKGWVRQSDGGRSKTVQVTSYSNQYNASDPKKWTALLWKFHGNGQGAHCSLERTTQAFGATWKKLRCLAEGEVSES